MKRTTKQKQWLITGEVKQELFIQEGRECSWEQSRAGENDEATKEGKQN